MKNQLNRYTYREEWSEEDQAYIARCLEFPSLSTYGQTPENALAEMKTLLDGILADMAKNEAAIPVPLGSRWKEEFDESLKSHGFPYTRVSFGKWADLRDYLLEIADNSNIDQMRYVYRGHMDQGWRLEPSLERVQKSRSDGDRDLLESDSFARAEKYALTEFQRNARHYATADQRPSDRDADVEWLAYMQHHGAVTRLLDITYFPFVAAFFAIDDLALSKADFSKTEHSCCIWMLSRQQLEEHTIDGIVGLRDQQPKKIAKELDKLFHKFRVGKVSIEDKAILAVSTIRSPSFRQHLQRGGFLYSLSNTRTFEATLGPYCKDRDTIKKLVLTFSSRAQLCDAVLNLLEFGLSYAKLLGNLEGFAKDITVRQYVESTAR